ncbi:heat shock protein Hsp90 family protein [Kipferlia bialata]|uniref:Heat shock protein Hsp90 family protein n=1 Tax=Kipferlia bialata TaxID=797122 RepID=A0A9K3D2W0_9EUKA|nr:heat shock protein Hsp90 family protein [Kipferlia bialata]GIQ86605.1 heat shock protein Hsp90 family protein [Kipferlia bialata]|eukprot:g6417.t1
MGGKLLLTIALVVALLGCTLAQEAEAVPAVETHEFEAQTERLLEIIVHSLYSNKDIFVRELVSNAVDALEKARFFALTASDAVESSDFGVRVYADAEASTLTIEDNGIGMSKQELLTNLGTIAESGTLKFKEAMEGNEVSDQLIGQFGVGFFSGYLVADTVTVETRPMTETGLGEAWRWSSDAKGQYSMEPCPEVTRQGTRVILSLNDEKYLEEATLRDLLTHYCEFLQFPVYLQTLTETEVEVQTETEEGEDEVEPVYETEVVAEWDHINEGTALWLRDPTEVTDEEYIEFYRQNFARSGEPDPLSWVHFKANGDVDYTALLYIPAEAESDYYTEMNRAAGHITLYVRRVFVSDDVTELVPDYLSFLPGVVDSDSLPINLSREMLQESRAMGTIRRRLVKKVLAKLADMADDAVETEWDEAWGERDEEEEERDLSFFTFYAAFAKALKLGAITDERNRSKILPLLRFHTSETESHLTKGPKAAEAMRSLADLVAARDTEWQEAVYFATGASVAEIRGSPVVEAALSRGIEVAYLDDPLDDFLFQHVEDYEDVPVLSLMKQDTTLPMPPGYEDGNGQEAESSLVEQYMAQVLGSKVVRVETSSRLSGSPSMLVSSSHSPTATQERLLAAQAMQDPRMEYFYKSQRVLEVNMSHPILHGLAAALHSVNMDTEAEEDEPAVVMGTPGTERAVHVLYEMAALQSGYVLDEYGAMATRVYGLLEETLAEETKGLEVPVPVAEEEWPEMDSEEEEEYYPEAEAEAEAEADEYDAIPDMDLEIVDVIPEAEEEEEEDMVFVADL